MTTQLIKEMPMHEYHEIDACSKSMLAELVKSTPLTAWKKYLDPERHAVLNEDLEFPYYELYKEESKKHFDIGTAVHAYVLEPDNFDKYVVQRPAGDLRSKANKAAFNDLLEDNFGKAVITTDDMKDIQEAAKNILAMKTTEAILNTSGFVESTILWERPDGTKMKCRPDFVNPDMDIVIDVKTAESAAELGFFWANRKFKYYMSHAITGEGYEAHFGRPLKAYIYLVVEKKTNLCAYYNSEGDCLAQGQGEMEEALALYNECRSTGVWRAYPDEIRPISLERPA